MTSRIPAFIKKLKASDFVRNAVVMSAGSGISQFIPILVIPVLTRIYTPEEIGGLAAFIALFAIFSIVAGGRYEYAVIMPEDDRTGVRLLQIAMTLSILSGAILFVIVSLYGEPISRALGVPFLVPWLWLLPPAITAQGLFMTFSFGLNRAKSYRDISAGKVSQTGSTAIIQILTGLSGWGLAGLVIGKTAGVIISAFWLVARLIKKAPDFFVRERSHDLRSTAAEYSNYPKYNAPHAFTTNVSNNLPVILFVSFFTEAIAGFYAMAIRATLAPVQIISTATGQVLGKRLAEKKHSGDDLHAYVKKVILYFAMLGLVPFGLLFIAGPTFFGFILGSEWAITGVYARIIIPFVFLTFVTQPLSYIPLLFNQQKKAFGIYLVSLVLRMSGIFTGILMDSFYLSLALYSLTGVIVLLYHLYWYLSLCKTSSSG